MGLSLGEHQDQQEEEEDEDDDDGGGQSGGSKARYVYMVYLGQFSLGGVTWADGEGQTGREAGEVSTGEVNCPNPRPRTVLGTVLRASVCAADPLKLRLARRQKRLLPFLFSSSF